MTTTHYPELDANPNFAALEQEIAAFWKANGIFEASVDARPKTGTNYVFYDGPPFANGLPHYGHLLTGYVKDAIARYHTMKGARVERRFGWDCHGLPAEMGAEKELNLSGRAAIMQYGIGKFNDHCRTSVMKYTQEWEYYVNRQGRWVDFANDYKTMDTPFMESVLWAFKQLFDKGLIYESMRVMPYSWAAETPLSNFETKLDNSYREREDKSAYVKFKLKEVPPLIAEKWPNINECNIVAWTTTPWTLPSNLGLAVGNLAYEAVKVSDSECRIYSATAAAKFHPGIFTGGFSHDPDKVEARAKEEMEQHHFIHWEKLINLTYEPLFPYFADTPNAFRVLDGSSFVTDGDGTGVVHIAPGFGEDDYNLGVRHNIPVLVPVDGQGFYTKDVDDLAGLHVIWDEASGHKNTGNEAVLRTLKDSGALLKQEQYRHSYPHCWRTDTPLIYRAMPSWYVQVTKFRDRAAEINQQINWIPSHIRDGQMDHMLRTAPDWSISRNRFWGTPIPVWRSNNPNSAEPIKVFGSIAELEQFFGQKVEDLHRPFIDTLTAPDGEGYAYTRVEDVFDCWFESGSMPFAQLHYPFENKEKFEANFPADFITEYVGQTRGWFNTLIMLSTALFDKPPFLNCICHGVVLDSETGAKYSKRLKNYKDPKEVMDSFGADALRWMMLASPVMRGMDLSLDPEGKFIRDVVRLNIKPLWSAYNFFTLYANADGVKAQDVLSSRFASAIPGSPEAGLSMLQGIPGQARDDGLNMLDRYILAKAKAAVLKIESSLDAYDAPGATEAATQFYDVLNNWYIRRSRPRFWGEEMTTDKQAAYDTLFTVLNLMCIATAPLLPFTTEAVYRGLNGETSSVHLQNFPDVSGIDNPESLVPLMDTIRAICTAGHAVRSRTNVRTRQPLESLKIGGLENRGIHNDFIEMIKDEVNVKSVEFLDQEVLPQYASGGIAIDARAIGKKLPHKTKQIIADAKNHNWQPHENGSVFIAGEILKQEVDYKVTLEARPAYKESLHALPGNTVFVILDLTITPELEAEGRARDLVRMIQQARKDAGLNVADRITLGLDVPEEFKAALTEHGDFIAAQTLATGWKEGAGGSNQQIRQELDGAEFIIGLSKVA